MHHAQSFLALWNDFDTELHDEYESWHTFEHVPERLSAPEFISALRYGAFDRNENRYFTLYNLDSINALETPQYQDLVDNPTPWSTRMRTYFSGFMRLPSETLAAQSLGDAGALAALAITLPQAQLIEHTETIIALLAQMQRDALIVNFTLGESAPNPNYKIFGQTTAQNQTDDMVNLTILLGTTEREYAEAAETYCIEQLITILGDLSILRQGSFDLLISLQKTHTTRPAPREDLRLKFAPDE